MLFEPSRAFSDYEPGAELMYVSVNCPLCTKLTSVLVNRNRYAAWEADELIQVALPDLSAAERETLITGICSSCWERMMR